MLDSPCLKEFRIESLRCAQVEATDHEGGSRTHKPGSNTMLWLRGNFLGLYGYDQSVIPDSQSVISDLCKGCAFMALRMGG